MENGAGPELHNQKQAVLFDYSCPHCGTVLRVENGKQYNCKACSTFFLAEPWKNEAKVCLQCHRYVFRFEDKCPYCGGLAFSENLKYFIEQANKKTGGVLLLWVGFAAACFLLIPFTAGLSLAGTAFSVIAGIRGMIRVSSDAADEQKIAAEEQRRFSQDLVIKLQAKLKKNADDIFDLEALGIAQTMQGDFEKGRETLERALAFGSKTSEAKAALAYAYHNCGKTAEAITVLEQITFLKSKAVDEMLLGFHFQSLRFSLTMIDLTNKIKIQGPSPLKKALWIGAGLLRAGEAKSAVTAFDAIRRIEDPEMLTEEWRFNAESGYFLAKKLTGEDVTQELLEWWGSHCRKLEATEIALAYFKGRGQTNDNAIPVFLEGFKQNPGDAQTVETLIDFYLRTKLIEKAKMIAELAYGHSELQPLTKYKMAIAFFRSKEIDRAASLLQDIKGKEGVPHDEVYSMLFRVYQAKGLMALAIEALMELEENHRRFQRLYEFGCFLQNSGKNEFAMKCFSEIYRHDAGFEDVGTRLEKLIGN